MALPSLALLKCRPLATCSSKRKPTNKQNKLKKRLASKSSVNNTFRSSRVSNSVEKSVLVRRMLELLLLLKKQSSGSVNYTTRL